MSMQTKPSIVFAYGIWADGSSFGKMIPALQAEGYEVVEKSPRAKLRCSGPAFRDIPTARAQHDLED